MPADEAMLPIRDQICTRIGTADDQEHNISTFLLEMKETAMICNSTTDRSLFLLDELGRATSNEDGVAVAWAVSEYLLTKRAMVRYLCCEFTRQLSLESQVGLDYSTMIFLLSDILCYTLPTTLQAQRRVLQCAESTSRITDIAKFEWK